MTRKLIRIEVLVFSCFLLMNSPAYSRTIFNYVGKEDQNDQRQLFIKDVLTLALTKTSKKVDDFKLITRTAGENTSRLFRQMDQNTYQNFFYNSSINNDILKKYHVINFPIDLGLTSYRVAFISNEKSLSNCEQVKLSDIKKRLTIQGIGWLDSDILKFNGFNVHPIPRYEQMFEMMKKNRASYFFRGIDEIKLEIDTHPKLSVDSCFALYYPLPRFFITNKDNVNNAKRIEEGLKIAFKDGSYQSLWWRHFKESIEIARINKRKIFKLENPFISNLPSGYQKYNLKLMHQN